MMRKLSLTNSAFKLTLLPILCVLLLPVTSRNQQTSPKQEELLTIISSLDHAFFEAYNKCELSKIESLFTSDIEFYHEKRGQLTSRQTVMEALSINLCGDKNNRVRRELVEGTLQVYPIRFRREEGIKHTLKIRRIGVPHWNRARRFMGSLWVRPLMFRRSGQTENSSSVRILAVGCRG